MCRDLETKLMKQSELLDEAVGRKATLQDEIKEIEALIAAAEAQCLRQDALPRYRSSFPPSSG